MRKKFKLLTFIFIMAFVLQTMFVIPAFAASEIVTESSVEKSKIVLKISDEQIKAVDVDAISISVGEAKDNNTIWLADISEQMKGANSKVISGNDLIYRINDGYFKLEIFSTSPVARLLGDSTRSMNVNIILTGGKTIKAEGNVRGVFVGSSETPSTGDDQNSGYLFLDYKYTHSDTANGGHWAYDEVKHLKKLDIVRGTTEGYLFPNSPISLKEYIALLSRVVQYMDVADNTSNTNVYKVDILNNKYDNWVIDDYSVLMNAYGIISEESKEKGKTELDKVLTNMENFNSTVTREEAVILMAALLGDCSNTDNPNYFKDWNNVNDKGRVARLCEYGIMYGTKESDGWYIYPTKEISRIEVIILLSKFMEIKNDILVEPASETKEKITANDTTDPVITFTPNGGTVKPGAQILFNVTDKESNITTIRYAWDTEIATSIYSVNAKTYSKNLTVPEERGEHVLRVWARNAGGKSTEWKVVTYVVDSNAATIDTTPPNITYSVGTQNLGSFTIVDEAAEYGIIKAEDKESGVTQIAYHWDNNPEQVVYSDNVKVDIPNSTDVIHYLYIRAQNGAGLWGEAIFQYKQLGKDYDNTAPEVSINTELTKISVKDTIKITAKDPETGVLQINYHWNSNSDTVVDCKGALDITIAAQNMPQNEGRHTLYVKAKNGAGIWSQEKTYIFDIVNTDTPMIDDDIKVEVEELPIKVVIGDDVDDVIGNDGDTGNVVEPETEIKILPEEPDEIIQIGYRWNDDDEKIVDGNELKIKVPKEPGVHYLYVRVKNKDGVWSGVRKYKFVVVEDVDDEEIKEVHVKITDAKNGTLVFTKTYPWDDIKDGKIVIKAPTKEGSYIMYAKVINDDNDIIEAKEYKFKIYEEDDEDDESNLVGKTKFPKTKLVIQLTKDGQEAEDAGMVTYPGNPELIGAVNPNVTTLKVEIRNADEKLMFEPKEEIKYYIDFYNGYSKKVDDVEITLRIPEGFEGVSASHDGDISKDEIVWDIGTVKAGGGNRFTVVIKYTTDYKEEVYFVPEVDITIDDKLEETSFVYNMIYDTGSISSGYHSRYVVGYPDGTFQPQGTITRAEMAAMFANLFGLQGYGGATFSDLDSNHWANSPVNACVAAGLIDTYGDYFDPSSPAPRSIFAIALARQLGVAHIEPIFINSSDTEGHYAMKEMEQLIRLGLVDGYPDGTAGPNNLVTRAEAVTMLNKYAFRGGLTLSNYSNYGSSYVFTDLSNGHWAINQILEAALDHNYMRTTNGEETSY